ncbi:MAG: DUF4446 family protein [Bacteroidetes bacterium]|nr:DUF4446 family protein [Bacteroidota bacterium]
MTIDIIIVLGLLIIAIAILSFFVFRVNKRVDDLFQGKDAKSLEDSFAYLLEEVKRMNKNQEITEKTLHNFNARIRKSLSGFKTIRFNPFPDSGGNQSFAIAIVNEEGDGFIISSLYTREKTSVFAKPIKNGKSEYELTNEEKKALDETK